MVPPLKEVVGSESSKFWKLRFRVLDKKECVSCYLPRLGFSSTSTHHAGTEGRVKRILCIYIYIHKIDIALFCGGFLPPKKKYYERI